MKNFLEDGDIVTVPAPTGGVLSGQFVVVGGFFGVAQINAAEAADVPLVREGIFTLPKATGAAWTKGDLLYWDAGAAKFTKTVGVGNPLGIAAADALTGDTTGAVSIEAVPEAAGRKYVAGQATTATAADTVATGLANVIACGATLESDPGDDPFAVSAQIGDQAGSPAAGSIIIKTWKNTGGSDPTPLAASTFAKKVNWWAYGT